MVYHRTVINTSPTIEANAKFIKTLASCRSQERRKHLIKTATTAQLLALVEIAANLLRGRIPIRTDRKRQLGGQANTIRRLSRVRSDKSARKILLSSEQQQEGKGPFAVASIVSRLLLLFIADLLV